jgi:hypothetical protein
VADSFQSYAKRLSKIEAALDGPDKAKLLRELGQKAKDEDTPKAVEGDLGDRSMSNWWRGRELEVASRYELVNQHAVDLLPTKRSRGPWRVLEEGRKAGGAFDLVQVGKRRKDGTRRGKSRGRNQGATQGKQTWSDAEALMAKNTPERVAEAYDAILRDAFR